MLADIGHNLFDFFDGFVVDGLFGIVIDRFDSDFLNSDLDDLFDFLSNLNNLFNVSVDGD